MCGGQVVEDIDQYNRVHEMLSILGNRFNRDMDDISSVQGRWDGIEATRHQRHDTFTKANTQTRGYTKGIKSVGGKRILITKLAFVLLHQPKKMDPIALYSPERRVGVRGSSH